MRAWGPNIVAAFGLVFAGADRPPALTVVFIADGAGPDLECSRDVNWTVAEDGWPVEVRTFDWVHPGRNMIADQTDIPWGVCHGHRLANEVRELKLREPARRVVLLGYSCGCHVCMRAADVLPPDTLERIVLIGASTSPAYDLRPALRASRLGIDSFRSRRDVWTSGIVPRLIGNTDDNSRVASAGRVGFRLSFTDDRDIALVRARFREYAWDRSWIAYDHHGFHSAGHKPAFLRAAILPRLVEEVVPDCEPAVVNAGAHAAGRPCR